VADKPFEIIRHRGEAKQTRTLKGRSVKREESLLVPEWTTFIKCTPYDNHFIYHDPTPNQSSYMCTCGAVAVVVPPGPAGMFVCYHHATYGNHTTGEQRWI
jgi:hypothetical protein